jgi:hypothetical protein
MSGAKARQRLSKVLEHVGLTSVAHRKVARGMRQRLGLAQAIVIAHSVAVVGWRKIASADVYACGSSPLSRGEAPRILAPVGSCPFDPV